MKHLGKFGQWTGELVGTFEKTEMDEEYKELEKKTQHLEKSVEQLVKKTEEWLHPNPIARSKTLSSLKSNKKVPQLEHELAEIMLRGAADLPPGPFATTLAQIANVENQIGEARDSLDSSIYENVLIPFTNFMNTEAKELTAAQKRVESKRLEYDRQRRKAHPSSQEKDKDEKDKEKEKEKDHDELKIATEKFESATKETRKLMESMLSQDAQRAQNLKAFVDAQLAFHRACLPLLENLSAQLGSGSFSSLPRATVAVPSTPSSSGLPTKPQPIPPQPTPAQPTPAQPTPAQPVLPPRQSIDSAPINPPLPVRAAPQPASAPVKPHCRALFDFPPENPGELGFRAGDLINIFSQMDENWFEGELNGQTGLVPVTYVEVLVPLQ